MKLYAITTSERASKSQGGNHYIIVDLSVDRVAIGQVELIYNEDIKNHGATTDEWVLQYRRVGGLEKEWTILDQDNIKGEKEKD